MAEFAYRGKASITGCFSSIILSPPNGNVKMSPHLLLREGDPSFAQPQTTKDGSVVRFDSVPVGTYFLFCQGPAAGYNSLKKKVGSRMDCCRSFVSPQWRTLRARGKILPATIC
jgi:hypothetical protein